MPPISSAQTENANAAIIEQLNSNIPDFVKSDVLQLCEEFSDVFATKGDRLTINNFYKQSLRLVDNTPVYVKNYRTPHAQKAEITSQVRKMLKDNIIEPSQAEYNSPILLVPKKSTSEENRWRLVVDYRQINKKLVADKFPLPRIDDILDQLGRAKWFSVVDLISGFHQIPLDEDCRDITTFSTDSGSFRFTRLPFGLKVSPNSFQRMMNLAFAGITPEKAFLYMDDLIVIGCSKNHHLQNLRNVFETCRKYNLKLNPEKCKFFQRDVTFLGHKKTEKGILPDDAKYDAILNYPKPLDADAVKRFVAFCNYYRRFIPKFAEITSPLNKLTRKNADFHWTEECDKSFQRLKDALIKPHILQYPDFSKKFIISCDASKEACGAILSQIHQGGELPIAYASKSFTKGECNKSTIEKELAAIHWAINFFRPYLYGKKFLVKSDHRPLVYLFSMKNPSSKLTRMRLDLEEYDFEIEYIPGKNNCGADALSRITINELKNTSSQNYNILALTRSMTKAQSNHKEDSKNQNNMYREPLIRPKVYESLDTVKLLKLPSLIFCVKPKYARIFVGFKNKFSSEETIKIGNDDILLEEMLSKLEKMALIQQIKEVKLSFSDEIFKKFTVNEFKQAGNKILSHLHIILYKEARTIADPNEQKKLIEKYHNDPLTGGHCGQKRLLKKIRLFYRWRGMSRDVAAFVKNCPSCQRNKNKVKHIEPMVITPTPQKPFDITCIDTIGPFQNSTKGNSYAITIQCELSKYVVIIPIPNKDAVTVARNIMNDFILTYGVMKEIRTDMGTEYKNKVLENLSKLLNIKHKISTAYHSQSIGGCERNHRVLNEYLRMYIDGTQADWDEWVKYYSFCYNTTPSAYHNYTPFELVFARKADMPDVVAANKIEPCYNIDDFFQEVRFRLQAAHQRAKQFLEKTKQLRKIQYDRSTRQYSIKPGDLVLISNENRTKLEPWYNGPFPVTHCDDVNCTLTNEKGKVITVHKNRVRLFNET